MTARTRRRGMAAGVLALGLLTGCTAGDEPEAPATTATTTPTPSRTPSASPTPTTAPSPSPSPEAEAEAVPSLEELRISTAGIGPLEVGRAPEGNPGQALVEYDPDACAEIAGEGEDPGRWVVTAYDRDSDVSYSGSPTQPFTVGADDESVYRIDVLGVTPTTAEGIGIGTPEDRLRATYDDLQGPYDNAISEVWWLEAPDGTLVFETQGPESGLREEGAVDSVILIRVLEPGASPEYGTANSDDVAGGCL